MNEIQNAINHILWSLWSELGVPGGARRHAHFLLDPEPLIVCTPLLAAADPRLIGLAFDWCAAHADFLSKSRIKALASTFGKETEQALARFNGALARCGIQWAPVAEPDPWTVNRSVVALPLERPALLRLRIRTLVGVSARSEVLTELSATRQNTLSAEELTVSGTTRRSTDRILAELIQGGFVTAHGKLRGRRFALTDKSAFNRLFGPDTNEPVCNPLDWRRVFQVIALINTLIGFQNLKDTLKQVEACRIRNALATHMTKSHQASPPVIIGRPDAFDRLLDWAIAKIEAWAQGNFTAKSIRENPGAA